jgi:hypothetical protein
MTLILLITTVALAQPASASIRTNREFDVLEAKKAEGAKKRWG